MQALPSVHFSWVRPFSTQGLGAGRWEVGKAPNCPCDSTTSRVPRMSPHVTACTKATSCLQPRAVSSTRSRPQALPAAEGQDFPRSTSIRFLPLCTWSSKQQLWLKPGAVAHSAACGDQPSYLVNNIKIKILNFEHLFFCFVLFLILDESLWDWTVFLTGQHN